MKACIPPLKTLSPQHRNSVVARGVNQFFRQLNQLPAASEVPRNPPASAPRSQIPLLL